MNDREALWLDDQRRRWMRPNAHHYIRHDAYRFMPTGSPLYVGRDVVKYFWPDPSSQPADPINSASRPGVVEWTGERGRWMPENDAALETEQQCREAASTLREIHELKSAIAKIRYDLAFERFKRAFLRGAYADRPRGKAGFRPDQPRVPAGNSDGGQWTGEVGRSNLIRVAQNDKTLTDAYGNPYYQPGGHHEMPKGVYEKWDLRPETRKVFRDATTGSIPLRMRTTPDGIPIGNFWGGQNGSHNAYNNAVEELSNRFLEANNIKPEQMSPDQARSLLKEIRESHDPRIRDFNNSMRLLRRMFRLRTGRGNE